MAEAARSGGANRHQAKAEDMRGHILDAAEVRARLGGYHGFSFRDVASDVGIKSASVHYHFPIKADLAAALAKRYGDRAHGFLNDSEVNTPFEAIGAVIQLFRAALLDEDKMCLCGLFGAERDSLPETVLPMVSQYFQMLLTFLANHLGPNWRGPPPSEIVATAEGALILARALEQPDLFEDAVASLSMDTPPL